MYIIDKIRCIIIYLPKLNCAYSFINRYFDWAGIVQMHFVSSRLAYLVSGGWPVVYYFVYNNTIINMRWTKSV
jgi:hypothetical protein